MKKFIIIFAFFINSHSFANQWNIDKAKSKIEFKIKQNSSFINGNFKDFSGKINFDPKDLKNSSAEISINLSSVESSINDAVATLKTTDWFNASSFPQAVFKSKKFTSTGSENKFILDGDLTIKGKTLPVKIDFILEKYDAQNAKITGKTSLNRANFDIGAKDPKNAHGVDLEAQITFTILANH